MDRLKAIEASAELGVYETQAMPHMQERFRHLHGLAQEAQKEVVTRKQFAEWCVATQRIREGSYKYLGYTKPYSECAQWAGVPEEWQPIVACLLTSGYAELWDWCAEQS